MPGAARNAAAGPRAEAPCTRGRSFAGARDVDASGRAFNGGVLFVGARVFDVARLACVLHHAAGATIALLRAARRHVGAGGHVLVLEELQARGRDRD